jgi:beta-lactamase regulating signal transducer with metallopeptidase domain
MIDVFTMASIALKTSLVVVAVGSLSLALRRPSAAFGHALWTTGLALCVLMPVGVLLLPSHDLVTLPAAQTTVVRAAASSISIIVVLWLIGSSIVVLHGLLAALGLARWRRHAFPLTSTHWAATLTRICATHGFDHRRLRVLESQHISSPCTWGVMRPVLLLPTVGDAWPESARYAALMHELAHIERRDSMSILVARLACALHWYNPLVWLAAQRVRSLQERACDDAVLRAGAMPSDYAQFLLDVAANTSGMTRPARAAIGMAHGSSLRARIVAILDPQATRSQPHRVPLVATCVSLFVLTILLASASVAVEPPPLPPIPSTPELPKVPELPPIPPVPAIPAIPAVPAVPPEPATSP